MKIYGQIIPNYYSTNYNAQIDRLNAPLRYLSFTCIALFCTRMKGVIFFLKSVTATVKTSALRHDTTLWKYRRAYQRAYTPMHSTPFGRGTVSRAVKQKEQKVRIEGSLGRIVYSSRRVLARRTTTINHNFLHFSRLGARRIRTHIYVHSGS